MAQDRSIFITQFDFDRLTRVINGYSPQTDFDEENLDRLLYDLERATIVDPKDIPDNVVTMNSRVCLRDIDTKEEIIFTLVFPQYADIADKKVSVLAPVGSAVLGYKAGEIIEWKVPARIKRLKIESVIYQPEAAGNYHL